MPTKESILIESDSILKIEIDHFWTAINFSHLFDSITRTYAYNYHLVRSLESLKMMGKEYNWGDKYENLPQFIDLASNFKHTALEILQSQNLNDYISGKYSFIISPIFPLSVRRITFGSKGSVDLLGIGKIFDIIKDLLINYIPNETQKLDDIIKEKEIEEHEQKILQMKIQNLKSLGLNSEEIRTIIGFESYHLNKVKELIKSDKINDLKVIKYSNK